ncbi:MAG: LysR family transcriptional regulator, partial [Peptococcaceae bacterium]|nr:LysR family transcriptional regulator [Peptococcaceae bacterium]
MKLEQLQQIVEIEKQKSISKAAKALYMGQPALSGALNSLEDEIGVRIFERTSSGVVPTSEGMEILQLAKQMLECQAQILNYGQQHRDLYGTVNILLTHAYSFLFSDIMVAFKEKYPKADLNIRVVSAESVVTELSTGSVNIAVSLWEMFEEYTPKALKDAGLQFETFGKHSMMAYVSQDNRFAENESVDLSELRAENFLAYSSSFWSETNKVLQTDKEALIMTDRENLKRMVSTGKAIALLPDTFALRD